MQFQPIRSLPVSKRQTTSSAKNAGHDRCIAKRAIAGLAGLIFESASSG